MLTDLTSGWTVMAVIVAIGAGIVLGETFHHVHVPTTWQKTAWVLLTTGALWYVSQNVRVAIDPDTNINVVRNIGGSLIWLLYASVAIAWRYARDRRAP